MIYIEDYMKSDQLQLIGYTDTDYAGCIDNRKSTFRLYFPDYRKMVDLVERSLQIHCDNKSYELYCNSDKSSAKSKHIDIKFLIIKDKVQNHNVFVDSDSIILNITDPLTK